MLSLRIDTGEIGRLARRLEAVNKKQVAIAIAAGLERAVKSGEKAAKDGIKDAYNIKPKTVADRMSSKVDKERLTATIKAKSGRTSRIPAIAFMVSKLKDKYPSIQVRKSRPAKVIKHAFIATMSGGHKGIFKRVPGTRKIKEVMGIDVPQMLKGSECAKDVHAKVAEVATKRIAHELKYRLDKALKG